ncbi:hypothetical protein PV327_009718 [Microctonus hyperodae]|uniref:Uncharacterized protein n=1 Tax=Microctonus hyperodae TaxID=165561 RepID=A0AA39CBA9_MICHY|nr:hypothetical protein PV327_009718 [Microctonus hyperodae]
MGDQMNLCHGKDVFERMNFLYQASQMIAKVDINAASCYGNMMINCAKKSVLRIEPDIKRSICKGCKSPLIPGESAKVRLISKPIKAIKYSCLKCKLTKRIPTKKGYKLWIDEPQACVKLYNYKSKVEEQKSNDQIPQSQSIKQNLNNEKESSNIS